jgi:DNA-binding CsgD family transcriptional regulator
MTRELFASIVSQHQWFPLFCLSLAFAISWYLGLRVGVLFLGISDYSRKIYPLTLIGSIYSFWAKILLPLPLVGIGMPIVVVLLLWAIARGLPLLKYCWSAIYVLLSTFLSSTISLYPLCVVSKVWEQFLLHTAWGAVITTGLEDIGLILILIFLIKKPSWFKVPFLTNVKVNPERLELSTFLIYFGVYYTYYSSGMITFISLINGYPHSTLFLALQIIMGIITVVVLYQIVKKFEMKITNLNAEKDQLAAEKANLAAETRRLETEKAELEAEKTRVELEKAEVEADKADLENDKAYLEARVKQLEKDTQTLNTANEQLTEKLRDKDTDPWKAAEVILGVSTKVLKSAQEIIDQRRTFLVSGEDGGPVEVHFSPREFSVLVLVAQGKSNPQIADKLELDVGHIKNIVSALLRKTGAEDRTGLALYAIKHGIVEIKKDNGTGSSPPEDEPHDQR